MVAGSFGGEQEAVGGNASTLSVGMVYSRVFVCMCLNWRIRDEDFFFYVNWWI